MTRFLSCLQAAFAVTLMSGTAYAAETLDLGTVVPGEIYEYPALTTVTGQYTPSQTGPVKFLYSKAALGLYTTPTHDEGTEVGYEFSYVEGQQMRTFAELTEGTTYYLYGFPMDSSTMQIFEGKTDLEVISVSPALGEGEYFSVSSNYTIDVAFNSPVSLNKALILAGGDRSDVYYSVSNTYVSCDVASAVMKMYREGSIKEGDIMTLRLVGVADSHDPENKYGSNGILEVEFMMAGKPGELVEILNASQSNAENPFYSYYPVGDPAGVVSFVFDTPLAADGSVAKITYGNPDEVEIGMYVEDVPGVNSDKTASFDFCGKLRRPIDMLPLSTSATQPTGLHILFGNIRTEDGQRVFTNRQSNPSGFSMSFKIITLQYTISTDFTPGRGSQLEAGQEMEIWVMNGMYIHSSGIQFDYTEGGQPVSYVVPMADVAVEHDPVAEEDMIYTFKVPAINPDEGTKVSVTFADAECADGLDHSKELTAEFGYATSGVEGIASDNDNNVVTVYNAAGMCLLKKADRSSLSSLPAGLYIVNGKKVIL